MPDYLNKIYYRNFTGPRFVKLPAMSCIEPHVLAGQLTLLECEEICISQNCQYISRPGTALDMTESNCWYTTTGGAPNGICSENVYQNPGFIGEYIKFLIVGFSKNWKSIHRYR